MTRLSQRSTVAPCRPVNPTISCHCWLTKRSLQTEELKISSIFCGGLENCSVTTVLVCRYVPVTPRRWPCSVAICVAGGGISWKMEIFPSIEQHASRDLSSTANLTLVTETKTSIRFMSPSNMRKMSGFYRKLCAGRIYGACRQKHNSLQHSCRPPLLCKLLF